MPKKSASKSKPAGQGRRTPPNPAKTKPAKYPDYDDAFHPDAGIVEEAPGVLQPSQLAYRDDQRGLYLYHGDCLTVMDTFHAKYPDGIFDLIFADPPYFLSNGGITCHARGKSYLVEWKRIFPQRRFRLDRRLLCPESLIFMLEAITNNLRRLYLEDPRPWMVGFSGGKDSTLVAHLIFEAIRAIPADSRTKEIHLLCTDTRVEIPAVVETIESTLNKMQKFSDDSQLGVQTHLLRPPAEQSFWVNIIGRGYPPPNRFFRWCTQRMKIDPVNTFVDHWLGRDGEAILHLGARRAESATRAQTLAGHEVRNGLRKHPDLPRVSVSNPIEHLSTEEVWAYLLQNSAPWGGTHKTLYRLYNNAGGGECPIHIDTSTPSCGNSRFGCWTCTVVERDKASEGLLASGDDRMEPLIAFRERLLHYQNPENGKRDRVRMNGTLSDDSWGPLLLSARKDLLKELLELQAKTGLRLITDDELFLIQQIWRGARDPDDGRGVARLVNQQRGIPMNDLRQTARLRKLEADVAEDRGLSPETLQRLVGKIEEYSEMQRAHGLQIELQRILQDDIRTNNAQSPDTQATA